MKGTVVFLLAALAFVQSEQGFETVVEYVRDWANIKPAIREVEPIPGAPKYSGIRIVGGTETTSNAYPFQAALFLNTPYGTSFCGGSLISRRYVLSAGHCVEGVQSIEVVLGAHNIRNTESTQQRFLSTNFNHHPDYDGDYIRNDIAVVELPSEATLNQYVQLVTLPGLSDVSNTFAGSTATAIGWGRPSDATNSISDVLRHVQIPVITNAVCSQTYGIYVQDSNICTAGTGGRGTCNGDSGGPLVVDGKLVGITSYGSRTGCAAGDPAAFTRVTSHLSWIQSNTDATIS